MKASANGSQGNQSIKDFFQVSSPRKNQEKEDEFTAILRGVKKL